MTPDQPYLPVFAPPKNACPFPTCRSGLEATVRGAYMTTVFSRLMCVECLQKLCAMGWTPASMEDE